MTCIICGTPFRKAPGQHLRLAHQINTEDYYNKYIKSDDEGKCVVCGKPTLFMNFKLGYRKTCSRYCGHRSHGPWNEGKKGLQAAWNKGLTKDDPRVAKSIRTRTQEQKDYLQQYWLKKYDNGYIKPGKVGGFMKGLFRCQNAQKYRGNPTNICYRSSWEFAYMVKLDRDPNVLEWSSEEVFIPYQSPLDNRVHRYFPDFFVVYKDSKILIEIKPAKETKPPVQSSNKRRLLKESATYARNLAKWNAATRYAQQRGWTFKVLTEKDLGIPNG